MPQQLLLNNYQPISSREGQKAHRDGQTRSTQLIFNASSISTLLNLSAEALAKVDTITNYEVANQ
jgi:hypothetical protein